jgi:hypothetical protein
VGVFENRALRRIFGQGKEEVTGCWRKLHNVECHNLYTLPSIIRMIKSRRMRWAGHVKQTGENKNAYRLLGGKQGGKRPLTRLRCRWTGNIKMDVRKKGWGGNEWIDLDQGFG